MPAWEERLQHCTFSLRFSSTGTCFCSLLQKQKVEIYKNPPRHSALFLFLSDPFTWFNLNCCFYLFYVLFTESISAVCLRKCWGGQPAALWCLGLHEAGYVTHRAWWHLGIPVCVWWPPPCWKWAGFLCGPAPCRPSAAAGRWSALQDVKGKKWERVGWQKKKMDEKQRKKTEKSALFKKHSLQATHKIQINLKSKQSFEAAELVWSPQNQNKHFNAC